MAAGSRRTQWRGAVYCAPTIHKVYGLPNGVRVLLLRLSDDMRQDGTVSVPRATLAKVLGVSRQEITARVKTAGERGWLSTVTEGRPGTTAVYRATFPDDWSGS